MKNKYLLLVLIFKASFTLSLYWDDNLYESSSQYTSEEESEEINPTNFTPYDMLIWGIKNQDIDFIQKAIKDGANINFSEKPESTPLLLAIMLQNTNIVELLISLGADPNLTNSDAVTPLIQATECNNKEIVDILLKSGAKVNDSCNNQTSALFHAIEYGNVEIAKLLIDNGADVNFINYRNNTLLMQASSEGQKDIVSLLIDAGATLSYKNPNGVTAYKILLSSIETYSNDIFNKDKKKLVSNLLDTKKIFDKHLINLIFECLNNLDIEKFKYYIKKIGTLNIKDKNGNNVLHLLIDHYNHHDNIERKNKFFELLILIISLNSNLLKEKNNQDHCPIQYALKHGKIFLIQEIISKLYKDTSEPENKRRKLNKEK